ncbi:MAG: RNA polymerase sigma factor (sigma-70 family) [Planctomycetota bacterium]
MLEAIMKQTIEQHFEQYARGAGADHLARVFDEVAPELGRVARYLVHGKQARLEAADLVQATFLTAIEKAQTYNAERPLVPWLVGILALHARQARGAGARNRELEGLDNPRATDAAVAGTDPQQLAQDKEWRGAVTEAVHNLPDNYGRVLRGVLLEGKRPAEVAGELALSPTHTRVNLHRGLGLLRRLLPGGYAFGLAAILRRPRGLAQVRAHVLSAATGKRVSLAAPATLPLGLSLVAGLGLIATLGFALDWGTAPEAPAQTLLAAGRVEDTQDASRSSSPAADHEKPKRALARASTSLGDAPADPTAQTQRTCRGRVHPMGSGRYEADIKIWLESQAGARRVAAVTDAAGRFEFDLLEEEVPTGTVPLIEVCVPGYETWRVPREAEAQERFLRSANYRRKGLVENFSLIDPLRALSIGGRVIDQAGEPVEGAAIVSLSGLGQVTHPRPLALTDSDGYFRAAEAVLEGVGNSSRTYPIVALAPGGTGYALPKDDGTGEDPNNLELRLTANVGFRVRVLDESGKPLPGATVQTRPFLSEWNCYDHPSGLSYRKRLLIGDMPSAFEERFTAQSDDEGWARFNHLPAIESRMVPSINGEPLIEWTVQAALEGYAIGDIAQVTTVSEAVSAEVRAIIAGAEFSTVLTLGSKSAAPADEN